MKKLSLLPLVFVVATTALPAQTTWLKLDGVTVPGSTLPHIDELKVSSLETNETMASSIGALSGSLLGKVSFANTSVITTFSPSTNALIAQKEAMSAKLLSAEIRFYDATNVITSKIEMGDVWVVGLKTAGAGTDMTQQIDLAFSRSRWWATLPGSPLKALIGWDITKNAAW